MAIKVLRGAERVRCRPAVIFGDAGIEGVQCAWERLSDVLSAKGAEDSRHILLAGYTDGSLVIEDRSRGVYMGENGDAWQELFCQLVAQPRDGAEISFWDSYCVYDEKKTPPANAAFDLCAVQYASAFMDVRVVRGGTESRLHFEKGENVGGILQTACAEPDSTYIHWKPDGEVFQQTQLSAEFLHRKGQLLALNQAGLQVTVCTDGKNTDYCYADGISGYLKKQSPNPLPFTAEMTAQGQERYNKPQYTANLRMGLCFVKSGGDLLCCHNGKELFCGGTHIQKILTRICRYLEWDFDIPVTEAQLREHLLLVVLTDTPQSVTCWENGSRRSIANTVIRDMAEDLAGDDLRYYLKQNSAYIQACFGENL